MRLRQFCAHPALINGATEYPEAASAKLTRLTEILFEIFSVGEKVLVFAGFQQIVDLLLNVAISRFSVFGAIIDGRTAIHKRQELIDSFSSTEGNAILVLNPRAAGTGLNIAAANHVIHFTPEWNPAVQDQASARAYRRGQERPVTVHRMFYVDSVEEVMEERMKRKRVLIEHAVPDSPDNAQDARDLVRALELSPVARIAARPDV